MEIEEVNEQADEVTLRYADGSQQILRYNLLLDRFNKMNDTEDEEDGAFTFSKLSGHKKGGKKGRTWMVRVDWDGHEPSYGSQYPRSASLIQLPLLSMHETMTY